MALFLSRTALRFLVCAGLLSAGSALAADQALPTAAPTDAPTLVAQAATDDEDDEDDEGDEDGAATPTPPATPGTPETPATPATPAEPAKAEPASTPTQPPSSTPDAPTSLDPRAQELVSGAPLYNPNVAVHIVEKKQFKDRGRHEITLYPAAVQANGKFTQHLGTAASYVWHVQENFGFQISPQYNWLTSESQFNQELVNKAREQAQAATSLLLVWGVNAGVEVTPLYGKFAFYEDTMAHFSLVLNGGAGVGATRHQLKPANDTGPATYGETGLKFLGSVGGGFRVQVGDQFAIRLEVRDLVYTARVDSVNGCDARELELIERQVRNNRPATSAPDLGASCKADKFEGVDASGYEKENDVFPALRFASEPSSDVLNNVGFYAGFSYLF